MSLYKTLSNVLSNNIKKLKKDIFKALVQIKQLTILGYYKNCPKKLIFIKK